VTAVTDAEPATVTDLATPPLWHARRVTAGHAADVTVAAELLQVIGLLPAQLAGETEHLLEIVDFDEARARTTYDPQEESPVTVTEPDIDMSPATIRDWAKKERLRVGTMGMVPRAITNAYLAAHGIPLAEQAKIARPTAPDLDLLPVTVEPDPVTVAPPTVTPQPDPVTVDDLRVQIDRLGTAYSNAIEKLDEERAEVGRLRADLDESRRTSEGNRQAAEKYRDEVERLEETPCPGTHCGQEAVCAADAPPKVVSTLPGPLPEEILDLLDAWHQLFAKADEVGSQAGHTLAELATPALVREASDRIHDLIRLLDGDTTP